MKTPWIQRPELWIGVAFCMLVLFIVSGMVNFRLYTEIKELRAQVQQESQPRWVVGHLEREGDILFLKGVDVTVQATKMNQALHTYSSRGNRSVLTWLGFNKELDRSEWQANPSVPEDPTVDFIWLGDDELSLGIFDGTSSH